MPGYSHEGQRSHILIWELKWFVVHAMQALAASGLRAIRYAKEVEQVGTVIACDNDKGIIHLPRWRAATFNYWVEHAIIRLLCRGECMHIQHESVLYSFNLAI